MDMCHSITIFDLKTNFFLIIPPKISTIFFFQIEFFFTSYRTLKNQSIIPVVKLMVSVITNKIISNGGIPLILFLFLAISNRCIQKKGINKLFNISQRYLYGRREFDSFTAGQACAASVSHKNIAIQRTQLTTFSIFYPNET